MEKMRKVVVNRCYGGFGLSLAGHQLYAKKAGFELFPYRTETKKTGEKYQTTYVKVHEEEKNSYNWLTYFKKDFGASFGEKEHKTAWDRESYFHCRDLNRDDPILVQVVEELGAKASGPCSNLEITEVPEDVRWDIEEYDGMEYVSEVHRTW